MTIFLSCFCLFFVQPFQRCKCRHQSPSYFLRPMPVSANSWPLIVHQLLDLRSVEFTKTIALKGCILQHFILFFQSQLHSFDCSYSPSTQVLYKFSSIALSALYLLYLSLNRNAVFIRVSCLAKQPATDISLQYSMCRYGYVPINVIELHCRLSKPERALAFIQ